MALNLGFSSFFLHSLAFSLFSMSSPSSSLSWFGESLTRSSNGVIGDPSLRLARDSSHGRRVLVGNGAVTGSTLLSEAAFVGSLKPTHLDATCAGCWQMLEPGKVKRCGACAVTRYCSVTCQTAHWNRMHKSECACLRHYKDRTPDLHPIYMPTLWLVCQILLWKFHRPLSAFRRAALPAGTTTAPTFIAQERARSEKESALLDPFDEWYAQLEQTDPNLDSHPPEARAKYAGMATLAREVTVRICDNEAERAEHARLFPIEWYVNMFGRLACNGFSVCDDELRPIGLSIFPTSSMVNHSCRPNAVAIFDLVGASGAACRINIRAIRPIASGEEVCISYIGLTQKSAMRRQVLKQDYFFDCQCEACIASVVVPSVYPPFTPDYKQWSEFLRNKAMDALKCSHQWQQDPRNGGGKSSTSNSSCPGFLLPNLVDPPHPKCIACQREHNLLFVESQVQAEVLPYMQLTDYVRAQLKQGVQRVKPQQLAELKEKVQTALRAVDKTFNSFSSFRLIALEQVILVAIELQDWRLAYDGLSASIPVYDFYYQPLPFHPLLGLQLMMHAKVAWLLEYSEVALNSWQRALPILQVTHGPDHRLTKEIQEAIPPAQMEVIQKRAMGKQAKAIK